MKKYCTAIFLSLMFTLAFLNASLPSVYAAGHAANSNISKADLKATQFHTESAIEHVTTQHSIGIQGQHGFQKTAGFYLPAASRMPVITHTSLYASNIFEEKELFDNNYLSHNYPSHNFW